MQQKVNRYILGIRDYILSHALKMTLIEGTLHSFVAIHSLKFSVSPLGNSLCKLEVTSWPHGKQPWADGRGGGTPLNGRCRYVWPHSVCMVVILVINRVLILVILVSNRLWYSQSSWIFFLNKLLFHLSTRPSTKAPHNFFNIGLN